jgi:nucleoside-diphosphate-sugar epimerase
VKRVLLTGGSGFIGRNVIAPLQERGFEIHAIGRRTPGEAVIFHEADLLDPIATAAAVQSAGCSHLMHLAWSVPPGKYWQAPGNLDWVAASIGLVRCFVEAGGTRAIVAGTCAEYDWSAPRLSEGETPYIPNGLYGASKDALRRLLFAYAETASWSLAWGHVFFLYGHGEASGRLVSDAARALLSGTPFDTTEGTQRRDFMYVSDVANAFVAIMSSEVRGPVNIGTGTAIPVRNVLEEIGRQLGRVELLRFGARPLAPSEPKMIGADCDRLNRAVGFTPRFTLEAGISSTLACLQSEKRE